MQHGLREIDHLVSAVPDAQHAGELLAGLGFTVTPLSVLGGMGVANRLVLFKPQSAGAANFVEVMSTIDESKVPRSLARHLRGEPGYRWLVLSGLDAAAAFEQLKQHGYPFGEPIAVERDWVLPSGEVLHVAFKVTLPIDAAIPFNFCEYQTLQHYVRAEFLNHPNGAECLTGVLCSFEQPNECLAYFETLFGTRRKPFATDLYAVGPMHVDLIVGTPAAWDSALGRGLPESAASRHQIIGCRLKVRDLAATETYLREHGFAPSPGALGLVLKSPLDDGTCFVFHS